MNEFQRKDILTSEFLHNVSGFLKGAGYKVEVTDAEDYLSYVKDKRYKENPVKVMLKSGVYCLSLGIINHKDSISSWNNVCMVKGSEVDLGEGYEAALILTEGSPDTEDTYSVEYNRLRNNTLTSYTDIANLFVQNLKLMEEV